MILSLSKGGHVKNYLLFQLLQKTLSFYSIQQRFLFLFFGVFLEKNWALAGWEREMEERSE